jgi:tight adherence protein C
MLYIVPFLVALAMLTAGLGIHLLRANRRRVAQRLENLTEGQVEAGPVIIDELAERKLPLPLQLVGLFGLLLPGQISNPTVRWDLAQAGYRALDGPKVFAGARALLTAGFALGAFFVSTMLHRPQSEVLMLTLVSTACGYMAPVAFLRWKQARRREEITLSLPDALDLMVICVEAGLGLNAAILNVGREIRLSSKELSDELRMVNTEMRAGVGRIEALRNLAFRTGVDEVRALVAVLVQSDRFGTSIAQALRTHAGSLRTRRRQRAEEAARKTPVKMVFPLVFCIFPELLVVILAPGMLQLFRALLDMSQGG